MQNCKQMSKSSWTSGNARREKMWFPDFPCFPAKRQYLWKKSRFYKKQVMWNCYTLVLFTIEAMVLWSAKFLAKNILMHPLYILLKKWWLWKNPLKFKSDVSKRKEDMTCHFSGLTRNINFIYLPENPNT